MKKNLSYLALLLAVTSLWIGLTATPGHAAEDYPSKPLSYTVFSLQEAGRTLSHGCLVLILKNTWAPLPWW